MSKQQRLGGAMAVTATMTVAVLVAAFAAFGAWAGSEPAAAPSATRTPAAAPGAPAGAAAGSAAAPSAPLANLDLSQGELGKEPPGWFVPSMLKQAGYSAVVVAEHPAGGSRSALLQAPAGGPPPGPAAFGNLMRSFDAAPYRGRRVRFRAQVKVQAESEGEGSGAGAGAGKSAGGAASGRTPPPPPRAQLWLRVDGPGRTVGFFDNMDDRPITSTTWGSYEIVGDVPADAETINLGLMLIGAGRAWLGSAGFETIAKTVSANEPARPLDARGLDNLVAFTRLVGLVRYFHPSDQAAAADWNRFVLAGVQRVEAAASPQDLARALSALFLPLAPTIRVFASDRPEPPAAELLAPPAGIAKPRIVAWRHLGLGIGTNGGGGAYSSERIDNLTPPLDPKEAPHQAPLPEPGKPLAADLGGGVSALVPLALYAGGQGTLPAVPAGVEVPAPAKPEGLAPSGNDRATRLADVVLALRRLQGRSRPAGPRPGNHLRLPRLSQDVAALPPAPERQEPPLGPLERSDRHPPRPPADDLPAGRLDPRAAGTAPDGQAGLPDRRPGDQLCRDLPRDRRALPPGRDRRRPDRGHQWQRQSLHPAGRLSHLLDRHAGVEARRLAPSRRRHPADGPRRANREGHRRGARRGARKSDRGGVAVGGDARGRDSPSRRPPPGPVADRRRMALTTGRRPAPSADRRTALALVVLALAVYNLNFRVIQDGDTTPARALPFALWRTGTVRLDAVAGLATAVQPGKPYHEAYWIWRSPDGHLYTRYPIVTPVLVSPLYAPAVAWLAWRGWEPWRLEATALRMEKLAASLLAALSVGLFYLLARRQADRPRAILAAVAYGFATGTWVISSQALWLHGTAELLAVCALLAATAGPTRPALPVEAGRPDRPAEPAEPAEARLPSLVAAGLAAGLLAANRPPDALLAAGVMIYLLARHGRRALWAVAAAMAALAPVALYNLAVFRHLAGGYGVSGIAGPHPFYSHPLLPGVAGLLLSPAKGLFVFSPFLLFLALRAVPAAAGSRAAPGTPPAADRLLELSVAAACAAQLLFYALTDYRAGACYGPRYLTDMLPFLVWLLVPVIARLHGWGLRVFAAALAAGIAIQAIGAFCYPRGRSDDRFYPPELPRLAIAPSVWSPANAPFLVEARAGLAPPELLPHRLGGRL
jgi:hypothetical protein